MIRRILVAVDDSPPGVAAARVAVALAGALHARLCAVHVLQDHLLSDMIAATSSRPDVGRRRQAAAGSVLDHVRRLAETEPGLAVEGRLAEGELGPAILAEARGWGADLVVVGRHSSTGPGEGRLGDAIPSVLEFAEVPVLVVPPPPPGAAGTDPPAGSTR